MLVTTGAFSLQSKTDTSATLILYKGAKISIPDLLFEESVHIYRLHHLRCIILYICKNFFSSFGFTEEA